MSNETIHIQFEPVNPGTDKTEILFYTPQTPITVESLGLSAADCQQTILITDSTVAALPAVAQLLPLFPCKIIIEAGEKHKTMESVLSIIAKALDCGLHRSGRFLGIGGGVICDTAAFAASVFMRGAKLQLVPTTLLAMVDASIGGKTGVDFDRYKNMVGSFYPAQKISIFPAFVQSQNQTEYLSGLAEVLKTALLYGPKLFQILQEESDKVLNRDVELLHQMIKRCVQAKASVVQRDLMEKNLRMHLNLGHTFGHALESLVGLGTITHGEAVAWGIGRALDLSVLRGLCEVEYRDEVAQTLKHYGWTSEKRHPALKADQSGKDLLQIMQKDKKNTKTDTVRCILQKELNLTVIEEVPAAQILEVLP